MKTRNPLKPTILLLFITMCITLKAQKNCKYDVDKKDNFTGESIKQISTILWGNKVANFLTWVTTKKGNDYTVELGIVFQGKKNDIMGLDDLVMVKLENGESITLTPISETVPQSNFFNNDIHTIYPPNFKVDKITMEKLSKSRVVAVRINLDKSYDFDFTERYEKNCKKLMEASACLLE